MYFLVLNASDNKERSEQFVQAHQGEMAHSGHHLFTGQEFVNFGLPEDFSLLIVPNSPNGRPFYLEVLHLSFGVSRKKDYGEIEATLKLMFGSHFLGRARKRREK